MLPVWKTHDSRTARRKWTIRLKAHGSYCRGQIPNCTSLVPTLLKSQTYVGEVYSNFSILSCGICAPEETEAAGSSTVDSKYIFLQQWRRWKTTDFFPFCNFSPNISAPCCVDIQRDKDHLQKHEVVCGCNCDI